MRSKGSKFDRGLGSGVWVRGLRLCLLGHDPRRATRNPRPTTLLLVALIAACARRPIALAPAPVSAPVSVVEDSASAAMSEMDDEAYLRVRNLLLPVAGADPSRVQDSFGAPRAGGRHHGALDIMAPRGTPVLAADDGRILRLSSNALGGITIYAVDPAERIVYYYAHLDRYFDGLTTGKVLVRGDTIGYVGTTGNAPEDVPHLHFQIMRMARDGKYWAGEPINPFPLLIAGHGVPAGSDKRNE
jgi:peptidoglycan LD-endopeptidase LytH